MKKSAKNFLLILLVALGLVGNTFAQAPEGIIYQAEARDENGNPIRNQALDVFIKIIQDDASGLAVWEGLHEVTTNNFGIFVLVIGHGTNTGRTVFEDIDWENHPHFLNVQVKTKKTSTWIDMGTQQLLSVPYALHSKTAETVIIETDPLFNAWDKTTGISITESQISDLGSYLETETDPAVVANFDFTDAANGDLLQYNGTKWVKVTPDYISDYTVTETDVTAHEAALTVTESQISDLGSYLETESDPAVAANFDFTDAANGDLLQYNGTKWVKVTPDYISDYTVTESDVTAHQAALTVTESQISDLGSYLETETDPAVAANFDFTGAATGDLLQYNGTKWVKGTPTVGEYYYLDKDQDGLGNPDCPVWVPESIAPPINHVNNSGDCADDNPFMTSIGPEICDGLDNDCDGQIDEDFPEKNTICYVDGVPGILICNPNNPFELICSAVPPPPMDMDNDGFTSDVDCNDNDASIYPGAPEICGDGIDQDCDGSDLSCGTEVVEVYSPQTGKTWMDRNLGAIDAATSSIDANAAYGDLYQWGRASDGHEKRNSGTTSTLSNSDTPVHGNFITVNSSPYDWRSPQNDDLWQGLNGTNNPCPSGYRLPTEAEWEVELQSWIIKNALGAFASPLKLTVAGFRDYSNGSVNSGNSYGHYWSSTVDGTGSRGLYLNSNFARMDIHIRAYGFSVRCLKDE